MNAASHPGISTCCTCGYSWTTGTNGQHDCVARLKAERDELRACCQDAIRATGGSHNWNGETRAFLLRMEKALEAKP